MITTHGTRLLVLGSVAGQWVGAAAAVGVLVGVGQLVDGARVGDVPWAVTGWVLGLAALCALGRWAAARIALGGQGPREADRRDALLAHLFRLGPAARDAERTGRFVSTATDGVERAAAYETTFLGPVLGSVTVPVVALVVLGSTVDRTSAATLAIGVPAIPLLVGGFQAAFRRTSAGYRSTARRFAARFLDALQGLPTATAYNRAHAIGDQLSAAAEQLRRQVMRLLAGNQLVLLVTDSAFTLAFVVLAAWLATSRLAAGALTAGEALTVLLTSIILLEPLDKVGQFFYVGMGGRAAIREIRDVLAAEPEISDPSDAVPPRTASPRSVTGTAGPSTSPADEADALAIEHLTFAYPGRDAVLHDVSLALPVGSRTAVIGPSGSGKSTLLSLVQGDRRPAGGRVLVLGHDTADVTLAWWRSRLSVVAQTTYLFTGTLADNLRLAAPGADDDELWHALDQANLADAVRALPDRLGTVVGERGASLSGGQAQRVAIARALLKDAPILLLDEPTAQVDAASEAAVVEALERAAEHRSVLVVAHRLTSLIGVDQVVVLDAGRVIERGTPDELAAADSYWSRVHAVAAGRREGRR